MPLKCYKDRAFQEEVRICNDGRWVVAYISTAKETCIFHIPTREYETMTDDEMPFIAGHFNTRKNAAHNWIPEIHMRGFERYLVSRSESSTW